MSQPTRVLSVGQCSMDHGGLSRHFRKAFDAEVVRADTFDEAHAALKGGGFGLVLVNRITDADGSAGLDLIGSLKSDPTLADLPVMLVSNYPDAQQAAVALGALPGFGKASLGRAEADEKIRAALATATTARTS